MQGKYKTWPHYAAAKLHRVLLHHRIERLVKWGPIESAGGGYTIVIGCNAPLAEMLGANLKMLERQQLEDLDRVIVVLDRPRQSIEHPIEQKMKQRHPRLPLEFIYYTDEQVEVTRSIGRPWVYCWLSWCLGIAAARTRYCLLHDFDAMLINPRIMQDRYEEIRRSGAEYCGVRNYLGNGITPSDGLAVTFELMFDLAFVRNTFRPIELANTIGMFRGRGVDFDIFLYAQSKAGKSVVLEIPDDDMVHPQQLICQFADFQRDPKWRPRGGSNLPLIPYFFYLAGNCDLLDATRQQFQSISEKGRHQSEGITFFGRRMGMTGLDVPHVDWLEKQVSRLERAHSGALRPEVASYFSAIRRVVQRTEANGVMPAVGRR